MNKEKTENKDQIKDNKVKAKKSSYSKKKKVKKNENYRNWKRNR